MIWTLIIATTTLLSFSPQKKVANERLSSYSESINFYSQITDPMYCPL